MTKTWPVSLCALQQLAEKSPDRFESSGRQTELPAPLPTPLIRRASSPDQ